MTTIIDTRRNAHYTVASIRKAKLEVECGGGMRIVDYFSIGAILISLASPVVSVRFAKHGSESNAYDRATDLP